MILRIMLYYAEYGNQRERRAACDYTVLTTPALLPSAVFVLPGTKTTVDPGFSEPGNLLADAGGDEGVARRHQKVEVLALSTGDDGRHLVATGRGARDVFVWLGLGPEITVFDSYYVNLYRIKLCLLCFLFTVNNRRCAAVVCRR